jgi:hypothetical protein
MRPRLGRAGKGDKVPVHDYKCATCSRQREVFLKIADLNSTVYCRCGQPMNRKVAAPWVRGDYPAYESPVVPGKIIEGRRAHEEHLRETGCRLLEPGESANYKQSLKKADEELEQKLEATADEFITTLPTEKRDRLAAEMDAGLDAKVERATPRIN